jgi:hypothetical protein
MKGNIWERVSVFVFGYCFTHTDTELHIRGDWSQYTDTSKSVDGNGAQNMVTVQSGFRLTSDGRGLSITGPERANQLL